VVFGVNHETLTKDDLVVSNGSCTTNCLAPVARVLMDTCGIERGYMTTVHSYTGDQPTLDTLHKDLYRARAAAMNIIPTSTGAAKALGLVIPELAGKLDGSSIRVPSPNVSVVDLNFVPSRKITVDEINAAFEEAASKKPLRGVLAVTKEALVSGDFNHIAASSTVALPQTQMVDGGLGRVLSWYDNEWGFSTRMSDIAVHMASLI
jgi:glyceraldehyde 3-phosphate dehydrogenase